MLRYDSSGWATAPDRLTRKDARTHHEVTGKTHNPLKYSMLRWNTALRGVLISTAASLLVACGPRANIPPRPVAAPPEGALDRDSDAAVLARSLAPVLFLQRDETFPLERVVAIVHPTKRVIAYHLLWRDDAHGSWIPFTTPTDQEIVWIGYDSTHAPTEVWTYWHGKILHSDWQNRGTVAIDVQWGKHGSLPQNTNEGDLPAFQKMQSFYAVAWLGIWDLWLGLLTRPGPACFCHGYGRYREFTRPLVVGDRIDAVARTEDPRPILSAVFGKYSRKPPWP